MDTITTADTQADTSQTDTAPAVNPFDSIRETATTETDAPAANPAVVEQDTAPSTTDQPTTQESPRENPLAQALAKPAIPAPVKPDPFSGLPPEIQSLTKDPTALAAKIKEWTNLSSLYGRQAQEIGPLRQKLQQYEGIDPQQARAVLQEQQRQAQMASLSPWNRGHPAHHDFRSVREMRRRDDQRLASVAPENRDAVRQALDAAYTPDELNQLKSYDVWRQREDAMSPEDREDRQRETARQVAREELQSYITYQDQSRRTHEFIAKNPDLMSEKQELLQYALADSTPRSELAAKIAILEKQLSDATGQRAKDARVVDSAKARDQIVKQTAIVSRDGNAPRRKADSMKVAKEAFASGESVLQALSRQHAEQSTPEQ